MPPAALPVSPFSQLSDLTKASARFIFPVYRAMPSCTSQPRAASASISSKVETPPAAVIRQETASRSFPTCSRSIPAMPPSRSTQVKSSSDAKGSTIFAVAIRSRPVRVFQPSTTISPLRASTATMSRSRPIFSVMASRKGTFTLNSPSPAPFFAGSRKAPDPTMIFRAPRLTSSFACSGVLIPPPVLHSAFLKIVLTIPKLEPEPMAASRSITATSP